MRLLVAGGRDFSDRATLNRALDRVNAQRPVLLLIHGAAPGADTLAAEWAADHGIPVRAFPADWSRGRCAGPQRNAEMIAAGCPDGAVLFPGGRGTADMRRRLEAAGVTVWEPIRAR